MGLIKSVKEKFLLLRNVKDNLKLGQVFLLPYPGHHFRIHLHPVLFPQLGPLQGNLIKLLPLRASVQPSVTWNREGKPGILSVSKWVPWRDFQNWPCVCIWQFSRRVCPVIIRIGNVSQSSKTNENYLKKGRDKGSETETCLSASTPLLFHG